MKAIKLILKLFREVFSGIFLFPIFSLYIIEKSIFKSNQTYHAGAQFLSLITGNIGIFIRKRFYQHMLKKCSNSVSICFGTIISKQDVVLGKNVYIGPHCMIASSIIEDNVLIGSGVDVLDGGKQHSFDDLDIPIGEQTKKSFRVIIGKNAWIGNKAIIMANIGDGVVIGAGSVVTKEIPPFSVAVGNPAKIIKNRRNPFQSIDSQTL